MYYQITISILVLFTIIFFTSCDANKTIQLSEVIEIDSEPDSLGNLIVINQLNEELLLYHNGILLKEIASYYDDFIINIPNLEGTASQLKIWKKSSVNDFKKLGSIVIRKYIRTTKYKLDN